MNTKMVRDFGTPRSTVEEGALAILKLATSAEVEGRSGLYFNGVGASGRASGSNLHFEVRRNNRPQNPIAYLSAPGPAIGVNFARNAAD